MDHDKLVQYIIELQNIAQAGLYYSKDKFDSERYQRVREIAAEMMAAKTELPLETVTNLFCSDVGYQTPKIDTRAAVFKDNKILLVQESNGYWSLPGGWCEFNLSPVDNIIKEVKEEAGIDISVDSLIAVQDRAKHGNLPLYIYGVVKIFYLCRPIGGEFRKNLETMASSYFDQDDLPLLDLARSNQKQVSMCFDAYHSENWIVQFD